ncbi:MULTISPECIES: hypothetical protein [Streptomyces]|uniref:Uncharacterized protein n=1 Tax=Streptomyces rimosus subsp. rimosus TaxID=132474 RepID=A0ABY3ZEG7_STRRM|nr:MULTISPECIES: hypothetical protein [Streptomyces]KEF21786.1 hypothetical protein DF18_00070 [Streptomyces rimosus]KOT27697.1 hypothetical protein ADK42_35805 [Streptomyces rimosus subsp. rimosus]KOT28446.1 hypothetical protein ADK84_35765 [Streptomyces sp. NRRL WC-3701]KOT48969.1 hypothetical protein ADK44_38230 [Streptomyces rimosus subsp. rimosus]KOT49891.1 hypothetical protein ADK45_38505 [Streptomyces rimosus subsp. rimosus]
MEEPREPVAGAVPDGTDAGRTEPGVPEAGAPDAGGPGTAGPEPDGSEPDRQVPDAPAAPQPLGVAVTPTGNADVDAQLRRLADADHLAASGHLEVYEDVHRGLRDALAALDQRPGPAGPSGAPQSPQPSATYDNRS